MRVRSLFIILPMAFYSVKCMNVVVKNIKTSTVQVAKVDDLYELGDTIVYQNVKSEIVRKRLKDGTIIKKGVIKKEVITENVVKPKLKKP
jgi:hypothetical protein